jgi:hypothetical protein
MGPTEQPQVTRGPPFPNSLEEKHADKIRTNGKIETYWGLFPDFPRSVVVKAELLVHGVHFTPAAVEDCIAHEARRRVFYLFTWASQDLKKSGKQFYDSIPNEFKLKDGPSVQTRHNPYTPYVIDMVDGRPMVCEWVMDSWKRVWEVEAWAPPFDYYQKTLNGKPMYQYAAITNIDWTIFATAFRACQYWGPDEECKFCDINEALRMDREIGRNPEGLKNPDDIAEAAWQAVNDKNPAHRRPHYLQLTGGAITSSLSLPKYGKLDDVGFYSAHVKAIRERVGNDLYIKVETIAKTEEECRKLKDAGASGHEANPEVLDAKLFPIFCPGKTRQIGGYDQWLDRVFKSVPIFGEGNVTPDVVQGIEMAQPWGYKTVTEALASLRKGEEFVMRNGVVNRLVPWFVEKGSLLSDNFSPPLEYFIESTELWYELWRKYGLPDVGGKPPRGQGLGEHHMLIMDLGDTNFK